MCYEEHVISVTYYLKLQRALCVHLHLKWYNESHEGDVCVLKIWYKTFNHSFLIIDSF